jgi:allophanate hydrolase
MLGLGQIHPLAHRYPGIRDLTPARIPRLTIALNSLSLDIGSLERAYHLDALTPAAVISEIHGRIARRADDKAWIHLIPLSDALGRVVQLEERRRAGEQLPLFGVPFAVKDNIDVAGLPTTAACPAFSYVPKESATAVRLLLEAGAILIGKTNLDQFATGLAGARSPYGACTSVFDSRYIAGGSSSGSAVAVAAGLVSFALGTDTAGSGRIPAGFNNIVGWKPTRGLVSASGVVPACRSLDCVSVLSLTSGDAARVGSILSRQDESDPYSRRATGQRAEFPSAFRFGVPKPSRREFFGNASWAALFEAAIGKLTDLGGVAVEVDFEPFRKAGELLYSGPWLAERLQAIEPFFSSHFDSLHPVTARVIGGGARYSATEAFAGMHSLESLRRETQAQWELMDCFVVPTAGTTYTVEEVEADPIRLNGNLGYYTSFANLLDLSGVAVPGGFDECGLPFGITILGSAFADGALLRLADRFQRSVGTSLGATGTPFPSAGVAFSLSGEKEIELAVVGAHLQGQPLNGELTSRGARLSRTLRTNPHYRLFALPNTVPPKPGLVRTPGFEGSGIEVEVWAMQKEAFGDFVSRVPSPLAIGTVELADGTQVKGFLCEPFPLEKATDISHFGGWRAYLESSTSKI